MWAFGFLCLLSVAAALPAPQSSENAEDVPFTNSIDEIKESSSEEKKEEANVLPIEQIPAAPELAPIVTPLIIEEADSDMSSGSSEQKEEKESQENSKEEKQSKEDSKEEEEEKKPDGQKPVIVTLDVNRPSYLANLFSNLPFSWPPTFQFSWPTFNLPSFPFFGGPSERVRMGYYPDMPNYRYVYVK